jgi:hypothetical protein
MKKSEIIKIISNELKNITIASDPDEWGEIILDKIIEAGMSPPLCKHDLNDYLMSGNCVVRPIDVIDKHCVWEDK